MSRLIPRTELKIEDNVDKAIANKGDIADITSIPPAIADDVVRRKLEKHGYTEDFYEKEQKLMAVHKLKLRRASVATMAEMLKITPNEVAALLLELKERIAESLRGEDPMQIVAEGVSFYDDMIGEALRQLDNVKNANHTKINDVVRLLEIAIKARSEKDKFLINTGILNNNQQNEHTQENDEVSSAIKVKNLMSNIISGEEGLLDE